jgi:hypothetical protein
MFVAGLVVMLLAFVRVPFAVRFMRRIQLLMWVYLGVMIFAAVRLWFFT